MQTQPASKLKLAVFDVEGVLIPRNRLFFEVGKTLGAWALLKILFFGFLYEAGLMRLKPALERLFGVTRGAKPEVFQQSFQKLPLMPDAPKLFAALRAQGCKTALISSGLPTALLEGLARKVGADYAIGVEVGVQDGILTGEVWGDVVERDGKLLVLKEIMEAENASVNECAVVADDRNNASIFLKGMRRVGYNPDFIIRTKADTVVTGGIMKLLPAINAEPRRRALPSKKDVVREVIHGSGFFVPLIAALVGLVPVASAILAVVAVYVFSELMRMKGQNLPVISTITCYAASQSEQCEFTMAPVYFAAGILLALLLFPTPAGSAAVAIFALGDSSASLIGGLLAGKPLSFNKAKSLEGSLGGFLFAFLAGCVFVPPWMALVGAAVAMAVESLPLPVNDNILIPLCAGLVVTLLI
ncbi:MAG: haloacid dehalogenase-like hydrolase [Candidatus Bathyarchaeia archaeon]